MVAKVFKGRFNLNTYQLDIEEREGDYFLSFYLFKDDCFLLYSYGGTREEFIEYFKNKIKEQLSKYKEYIDKVEIK